MLKIIRLSIVLAFGVDGNEITSGGTDNSINGGISKSDKTKNWLSPKNVKVKNIRCTNESSFQDPIVCGL